MKSFRSLRQDMDPNAVTLIADRRFGKRIDEIPQGTPIWIVESQDNGPAIAARRERDKDAGQGLVTSYRDNFQLSPAEAAANMIGTVVEHHAGMSRLTLIGVPLSPVLAATLATFGFAIESEENQKLQFARRESGPGQSLDTTLALARIMATSGTRETPAVEERAWWFAQRKYLPGWGLPVCWQGWAVTIGYFILLLGPGSYLARWSVGYFLAYLCVLTVALVAVVAAKGEPFR
jgi:hypothetical protein